MTDIGRKAVIRHASKPSAELIATIGHWSFKFRAANLTQYQMLLAAMFRRCDADGFDARGFRPRHLGPETIPIANDSDSSLRSSASRLLRSPFFSRVSFPCLYCGWFAPRMIVSALRAP